MVLSEKRVRDTAGLRMDNDRLAFLLPGQPVSRPTVGTVGTISNATVDGLRAFYHGHYRPDRAVLVVVGNVVPAGVEADIKARFDNWKPVGPAPPSARSLITPGGAAVRIFTDPGASNFARLDWQLPYDYRPDSYARQADYLADTLAFHATVDASIGARELDGKLRPTIAVAIAEQKRLFQYGVSQAEYGACGLADPRDSSPTWPTRARDPGSIVSDQGKADGEAARA